MVSFAFDSLDIRSVNNFRIFAGYYRVNYDAKNWQLIYQQLIGDHNAISVINRAQIMDDALNLAPAGKLDYDVVLNLTLYLAKEVEYLPWESALSGLSSIADMMSRSSGYGLFKAGGFSILNALLLFRESIITFPNIFVSAETHG